MIPDMKLWQRVIAWLLFKLESRHEWGGGFEDDSEGEKWLLQNPDHACMSWVYSIMRDYHYAKSARRRNE